MTLVGAHPRILVLDDRRSVETATEMLFASDEAAAIERILDDVADVAGDTVADSVSAPLRQALYDAFTTHDDRAWHSVYEILAAVVATHDPSIAPAFERLALFVIENDDLASSFEHP